MTSPNEIISQYENSKTNSKKKVASVALAALLSVGCLGAGLAYLTDTATINQQVALAGFDKIDDDTVGEDLFKINYANTLDAISNALPGQTFEDVTLSVTNEDYSVDSSYIQIDFKVPVYKTGDTVIVPVQYNWNTTDWDISGLDAIDSVTTEGLSYIDVTAQHKAAVDAGDNTAALFDGMTIDSNITREILVAIGQALGYADESGDVNPMSFDFDATGIQSTGFDDYQGALGNI